MDALEYILENILRNVLADVPKDVLGEILEVALWDFLNVHSEQT